MTVVVVGGGIAGLTAAYELAAAGTSVTLIDSGREVGGNLRRSDVAGVAVDEGAEAFVRRRPEALELITKLGLADGLVTPATSTASVWARGRLRPMPAGTVMGVPSRAGSLRGVLSAAEVARARADGWLPGNAPEGDVSVGQWIGRRLGPVLQIEAPQQVEAGIGHRPPVGQRPDDLVRHRQHDC